MDCIRSFLSPNREVPQGTQRCVAVVESGGINEDERSNPHGESPILASVRSGNIDWLKELVSKDPNCLNDQYLSGVSETSAYPLFIAAQVGHVDILKFILQTVGVLPAGVELLANMLLTPVKDGVTPIIMAAQGGYVDVMKLMFETAKPHAELVTKMLLTSTKGGATPTIVAASNGHVDVMTLMFETVEALPESANLVPKMLLTPRTDGVTPTLMAAQNGHVDVMKLMFDTAKQQQNDAELLAKVLLTPNTDGVTPTIIAAYQGHTGVLELMFKAAKLQQNDAAAELITNMLSFTGKCRFTPLFLAASQGHGQVVDFLLKNGANPEVSCCMASFRGSRFLKRFLQKTPIEAADQGGHVNISARLATALRVNREAKATAELEALMVDSAV